jgi:hypothetical protein
MTPFPAVLMQFFNLALQHAILHACPLQSLIHFFRGTTIVKMMTNNACRNARHRSVRRDFSQYHTACCYLAHRADLDIAQNLCAGTNHHTAANLGMAVAVVRCLCHRG